MTENQVQQPEQPKNEVALTGSEKFVNAVSRQFTAELGNAVPFTDYEKTLAQHMFLKLDSILKDFETKRLNNPNGNGAAPYKWENINMRKLALDAVHRVNLGLDALIPNHIHPVPYFNKKEKKYDVDLRVGYVGKAYYRSQMAVTKPIDVVNELVYSNDYFVPIKKGFGIEVETYEFKIQNPFDRGEVIGGFGYLSFDDPKKNQLIIVTKADFEKSKKAAQSKTFWDNYPIEMMYKTLVHRTTEKLQLDPKKINAASYGIVEHQEAEMEVQREIIDNANMEVLDMEPITYPDSNQDEYPNVNMKTGEVLEQQQQPEQVQEQTTQRRGPNW